MNDPQPKSVDATFYAVVVPVWKPSYWKDDQGRPVLEGAKVERITQTKPVVVRSGGIVTRLTLRIDAGALLPLQPQAVIHIAPGQVEIVEAEATDPREEDVDA